MMKGCHCFGRYMAMYDVSSHLAFGLHQSSNSNCGQNGKWQHTVPKEFKDVTCPKPPDAILNKFQQDKKEKSKNRRVTKKAVKKEEAGEKGENQQPEMLVDDDADNDDSLDSNLAEFIFGKDELLLLD